MIGKSCEMIGEEMEEDDFKHLPEPYYENI